MAMKRLLFVVCLAFALGFVDGRVRAQTAVWKPSAGHTQVAIWPGMAPDSQPTAGPEVAGTTKHLVAGRSWDYVSRVSQPTMTIYSPQVKNTGAAVVVFPGGGYEILAIDLEGTEVCDWLTSKGITCVLLKYRVPGVEHYPESAPYRESGPYPKSPMALEDAQRTMGLVRLHAAEWHIDPQKVGVLGFSAGGHLSAAISNHFAQRLYPMADAADKESCRPDFAVALYTGHLWIDEKKFELNPDIRVTSETPPTFLVQAEDDPVDSVNHSLVYYVALKRAGVPVEMHLYAQGGHAFGPRRTKFPITAWPELVEKWLRTIGMIGE
jgi:acetyl esterase/lipase